MAVIQTKVKAEPVRLTGKQSLLKRIKDSRTAWLYILPSAVLMLIITLMPQIFQVWMSFTDYRIKNLRFNIFNAATWDKYAPVWVGIQNYIKILTNNLAIENYNFGHLLLFNITWTVVNVVFHVSLGVLIALALKSEIPDRPAYLSGTFRPAVGCTGLHRRPDLEEHVR